ncbi:MAG: hypothetical protein E7167_01350 [Firmicutes bacterium]|nr:hypothetical protein [Bacillota bacterium]
MLETLPKEKWMKAFAAAVDIAISQDYFSDILFFDLYPDAPKETAEDYEALWKKVDEAYKEIFGINR